MVRSFVHSLSRSFICSTAVFRESTPCWAPTMVPDTPSISLPPAHRGSDSPAAVPGLSALMQMSPGLPGRQAEGGPGLPGGEVAPGEAALGGEGLLSCRPGGT